VRLGEVLQRFEQYLVEIEGDRQVEKLGDEEKQRYLLLKLSTLDEPGPLIDASISYFVARCDKRY